MSQLEIIHESTSEKLDIAGSYDVVVIGGGIAGVAAALAARRSGRSVIIIEKGIMLGGLATMGIITWYLPICDGYGRKIESGLAEELLYKSIQYGYDTLPEEWRGGKAVVENPKSRYFTRFSPAEFVVALDEMMEEEGIDCVFDSVFSRPVVEDGVCKAVIVEEKGGRNAYTGKVFIDASGDCDLFFRAGSNTVDFDNWCSYWSYNTDIKRMQKAIESGHVLDAFDVHWYGDGPEEGSAVRPKRNVRNAREVTEFVLAGRRQLRTDMKRKGKGNDHATVTIPAMAQVRTSRRIAGVSTLTPEDIYKHSETSISAICDWRHPGPLYEIPYGCLYTENLSNVFAAGRCISSTDDAWEVTRVIPVCALTGQAAGTAASMLIENGTTVSGIDVKELQKRLENAGVMIHF
ncbi:MAG: FAD-dependent oxidoreductase [Spirochaetales bacterium]|nr:FAD-dependent oxidoreductase [Spirochaetales bacterium]